MKGILEFEDRVYVFFDQLYLEIKSDELANSNFSIKPSQYRNAKSLRIKWQITELLSSANGEDDGIRFDPGPFKIFQITESIPYQVAGGSFEINPLTYLTIGDKLFTPRFIRDAEEMSEALPTMNDGSSGEEWLILEPYTIEPLLNISRDCPYRLFVLNKSFYCYQETEYYQISLTKDDRYRPSKPDRFEFAKIFESIPSATFSDRQRVEHVFRFKSKFVILTRTHVFTIPADSLQKMLPSGELWVNTTKIEQIPVKFYDSMKIESRSGGESSSLEDSRTESLSGQEACPSTFRTLYAVLLGVAIVLLILFAIWQLFIKGKQ